MKSLRILILFVGSVFAMHSFYSCERDDICAVDTETTPLLIIKFIDNNTGVTEKEVNELKISAEGASSDIVFTEAVDSILIPLKTDASETEFIFTINSNTEDDDMLIPNEDTLSFQYTVVEEYLSSACGFKASYRGLTTTPPNEPDDGNWIKGITIEVENIINEKNTHVLIFH